MQEAEDEASWDERIKGAVQYLCLEVVGWIVFGTLYLLAGSIARSAGIAAIVFGVFILALVSWRARELDTIVLDNPDDYPPADNSRERARR